MNTTKRITLIEFCKSADSDADLSWLEQPEMNEAVEGRPEAEGEGFSRIAAYKAGDWQMIGLNAVAHVEITTAYDRHSLSHEFQLTSGGLWNVESDSGNDYFASIGEDELAELRPALRAIGFTDAEINSAPMRVTESV